MISLRDYVTPTERTNIFEIRKRSKQIRKEFVLSELHYLNNEIANLKNKRNKLEYVLEIFN